MTIKYTIIRVYFVITSITVNNDAKLCGPGAIRVGELNPKLEMNYIKFIHIYFYLKITIELQINN